MADLSFGVALVPRDSGHGRDLVLRLEDTAFDTAWLSDTLGDPTTRSAPLLDAWVTLGALAAETEDLELGMLVSNLAWRDPVQVARFAMTVDQLSNGRFVLGLGCEPGGDHAMAGVHQMPPDERAQRLAEGTSVIDRLLRQDHSDFSGRFTRYSDAAMAPGCVQQPRLPITLTGNDPTTVELAARLADTWASRVDTPDLVAFARTMAHQGALLDEHLAALGRDPTDLTRSLVALHPVFDAWSDHGAVPRLVEQFAPLGVTEFVFSSPRSDQGKDFLTVGLDVISSLQG